jgi:hypothetical protein
MATKNHAKPAAKPAPVKAAPLSYEEPVLAKPAQMSAPVQRSVPTALDVIAGSPARGAHGTIGYADAAHILAALQDAGFL